MPAGWETYTSYNANQSNANQVVYVDSTRAYSGSKSLRVKGATSGQSQIIKKLPSGLKTAYLRAWVYMSVSMGNEPENRNPPPNHDGVMGVKIDKGGDRAFSHAEELRVGTGKGHLGYSLTADSKDAISPEYEKWFSGPATPVNQWYCIEASVDATKAYDETEFWVDGVLVQSATSQEDWHAPVNADWAENILGYAFFGWDSHSQRSADLWMDDIVVSGEPIGCN